MFRKVLLPVDGSSFAEHALPFAVHAARTGNAELLLALVHVQRVPATADLVLRDELQRWESEYIEQETAYLNDLAARVGREHNVRTQAQLLSGEVVPALAQEVRQQAADLVVMTTHGRAGMERAWLGSVADALIRHIEVPLLLIRPSDEEPEVGAGSGYSRVIIALDGSERAERCIAPALALCAADAGVTLLRVPAPPAAVTSPYLPHAARFTHEETEERRAEAQEYLAGEQRRLGESVRNVDVAVVMDYHPARAILRYAAEAGADLIAVGTHGRGPITRTVLGSVSDKVIRAAGVPVLVC
jgi:nucleotide-binding universal stress UspA family protein